MIGDVELDGPDVVHGHAVDIERRRIERHNRQGHIGFEGALDGDAGPVFDLDLFDRPSEAYDFPRQERLDLNGLAFDDLDGPTEAEMVIGAHGQFVGARRHFFEGQIAVRIDDLADDRAALDIYQASR